MQDLSIEKHCSNQLKVNCAEATLRIVIGNILRNACLYTVEGKVEIRCSGSAITITDNGPGLSQVEQRRIFEPFFRIDDKRNSGGSGLGLALVKTTCDTYGWTINVDSASGGGSSFTIDFGDSVT